jgi:hypothetical protein
LPVFRGEFAPFPAAVREYEIQEFPFFHRGLTFEQDVGIVRQLKELDAFFDVVAIGGLMRLDVAHDTGLHRAHLGCFRIEIVVANAAVELVFVHGVDPALKALVLALELGDRIVVELAFIPVALTQGLLRLG